MVANGGLPPTTSVWREWLLGSVRTIAPASAAPRGTSSTSERRRRKRRDGVDAAFAAIRRTRSRTSGGAVTWTARNSATRSRCDIESLLELLERTVETRRAVGFRDAEHARGSPGVEIEHDAERDDLALAGGEPPERRLEIGRETLREAGVEALVRSRELLAAAAAALGAEVVERDRARDLAEPGASGAALRVEAVPQPQRALERLAGQILRGSAVAR